jgi:hypothetical protein
MVFKTANQSLYAGGNAGWTGDTTNTAVVNNQTISYWIPKMEVNKGKGLTAEGDYIKVNLRNEVNNTTYGSGEGGLKFDANETLVVNAPTCNTGAGGSDSSATPTPNAITNTNEGSTDDSGRLVWTGSNFDCQRISDQISQNWGSVTASTGGTNGTVSWQIPNISVNQYGELYFTQNPISVTGGTGINIDASGNISLNMADNDGWSIGGNDNLYINTGYGLVHEGDNVRFSITPNVGTDYCTGEGQGLSWTGGYFGCTTPYRWKIAANSAGATFNMGYDAVARFQADGAGLTVARTASSGIITYTIDPEEMLEDLGLVSCAANRKLDWTGSAFICETYTDNDTTYSGGTDISISGTTINYTGASVGYFDVTVNPINYNGCSTADVSGQLPSGATIISVMLTNGQAALFGGTFSSNTITVCHLETSTSTIGDGSNWGVFRVSYI